MGLCMGMWMEMGLGMWIGLKLGLDCGYGWGNSKPHSYAVYGTVLVQNKNGFLGMWGTCGKTYQLIYLLAFELMP